MEQTILRNPTVADVVKFLSGCPREARFIIEDADTNWVIDTIHADVLNGEVSLFGQYDEMKSEGRGKL